MSIFKINETPTGYVFIMGPHFKSLQSYRNLNNNINFWCYIIAKNIISRNPGVFSTEPLDSAEPTLGITAGSHAAAGLSLNDISVYQLHDTDYVLSRKPCTRTI